MTVITTIPAPAIMGSTPIIAITSSACRNVMVIDGGGDNLQLCAKGIVMPKTKVKHSAAKKETTRRNGAKAITTKSHAAKSEDALEDLGASFDQLGAIMAKGLEVVETGMTLSVKLLNRLNSAMQLEGGDGMDAPARPQPGPRASDEQTPRNPAAYSSPAAPEAPPAFNYIANRLPLFPSSAVAVAFTINNDSPTTPKELQLHVEGFVGETQGAQLDGNAFVVEPATLVIAPMDFDKFTLKGILPPDARPDIYDGWVVVAAEEKMRIPVRLIVNAPG